MADEIDAGCDRPKTGRLPGTVKPYGRHVFMCTGGTGWPAHVEEDGGFGEALAQAIAARSAEVRPAVKLTACDAPSQGGGCDLLVFPDMVRYTGVETCDLGALVDDHLIGGHISERLTHEVLGGRYVFVCVHGQRDARCGTCGVEVAPVLAAEIERRDLGDRIHVYRTSHVGGHEYAANVLVYPDGDWYGYVTPGDVVRIVQEHLLRGQIVWDHWRGRMGMTAEQMLAHAGKLGQ